MRTSASRVVIARWKGLTGEERRQVARLAARARWQRAADSLTAADAPMAVQRLLKTYDPGSLRWANRDDRHAIVREILTACEQQPVTGDQFALVFSGTGWHRGVVGIVASRIVERVRGLIEHPVLATRALPLQHLEDATVASNGATLDLEVRLPAGHTFTAAAPQRVELSLAGHAAPVQLQVAAGGLLHARTPISRLKTPSDAVYSVSLYYCRDGQGAVCLVDRRRLAT